ncbi:Type VI secretion system-associated protein [Kosakonia sp. BK9b]
MKLWLPGLALLAVCGSVHAENFRIAQSPSQKLDVWIDNIADNTPKSWCARELPLRIVANGDKKPSVLNNFLPRLGTLLENQCGTLTQVRWKLTDAQGATLAEGTADKAKEWAVVVTPGATSSTNTSTTLTPPAGRAEDLSPLANRAPWQEFTLQDGCHLRTFWQGDANAPALFIPAKEDGKCEKGGWLNGRSDVTQLSNGVEKKTTMTFVHGFPVSGLSESADADRLLITTVNNERMVVSEGTLAQSWMILPYVQSLNGWKANGTVAVEISRDVASDETRLRARIDEVRKVWAPWFEPGTRLNILLIDSLHPQLRDPAVGKYRTLN